MFRGPRMMGQGWEHPQSQGHRYVDQLQGTGFACAHWVDLVGSSRMVWGLQLGQSGAAKGTHGSSQAHIDEVALVVEAEDVNAHPPSRSPWRDAEGFWGDDPARVEQSGEEALHLLRGSAVLAGGEVRVAERAKGHPHRDLSAVGGQSRGLADLQADGRHSLGCSQPHHGRPMSQWEHPQVNVHFPYFMELSPVWPNAL
eukprot:CAMPEP_0113934902 /NCGR_PEP_ID=MMETSP1339-20121228/2150_1 /TAXON_ID=94617 /ORGANISM="Fibrocapsa japonica" /LENGTH=198 /DNA_ID=CAMNT_0000936865 /DNA_START=472 /DNA_END=1068 /DNA_ORIENTATION=+ /assembly_acc=CAM_ASM_000762